MSTEISTATKDSINQHSVATHNRQAFLEQLTDIVGHRNVLTGASHTEYYRSGYRAGDGPALAVVFPGTLLEQWQVLQACIAANKIVIMQAANTGLTGGSTPSGDDYDREIVVINTLKVDDIYLLNGGIQVLSFSGATLFKLERLLNPLKRQPHSVIGSSCLGASIVGGIANNSGGALVKRGPAYTELALYAQINARGELKLVNHLGIELGNSADEILTNLQNHNFTDADVIDDHRKASATDYEEVIRQVDANSPARYNADASRLHEASGCAGKIAVFAVRLDTFPTAEKTKTFYIGTNDPNQLTQLRRDILSDFDNLPEVAEYMHRDIYDISLKYGKDSFLMINFFGTGPLPRLFALKGKATAFLNKLSFLPFVPRDIPDRFMQLFSQIFPSLMPKRIREFREKYEHYLILKMSDEGIAEAESYLFDVFDNPHTGDYFECTEDEAKKAYLNRFAAAGAAVRYQTCHQDEVEDILALDIALKRNDTEWNEQLPGHIQENLVHCLYYGHFLCHVFHRDYIVKKGADVEGIKAQMLELLSQQGAKYPAEHNVGHLYEAEEQLKDFYSSLDPTNSFNPGIGKTSKLRGCGCH